MNVRGLARTTASRRAGRRRAAPRRSRPACPSCAEKGRRPGRPARRRRETRRCAGVRRSRGPGLPRPTITYARPVVGPFGAVGRGPQASAPSAGLRRRRRPRSPRPPPAPRSIPASAWPRRARPRAARPVAAPVMLMISVSGSTASVEPLGQLEVAGMELGAGRQALDADTKIWLGIWVASASRRRVLRVHHDQGVGAASPLTWIGDVDGDLLAAANENQVDVLEVPLIGLRCTCLGRASSSVPLTSIESSALLLRSASRVSWPGSVMCTGWCRGRTARRGPCGRGGCGGQRPYRTRCALRR